MQKLHEGKKSKVFQRKECSKFSEDGCFSVTLQKKERIFYVENEKDYQNWRRLFKWFLKEKNGKMKNTGKFSETQTFSKIKPKFLME